MDRRDWNLLVLAAAKGDALSPVQYQKSLFLLSRKLPSTILGCELYEFTPYNYGPFDSAVYHDAVNLSQDGLATVTPSSCGWTEYAATAEGIEKAQAIGSRLAPGVAEYIKDVVDWVRSQSFASLVRSIYNAYPEMKENSVFQD